MSSKRGFSPVRPVPRVRFPFPDEVFRFILDCLTTQDQSSFAACCTKYFNLRTVVLFMRSSDADLDARKSQSALLKKWASSQEEVGSVMKLLTDLPLYKALSTPRSSLEAMGAIFTLYAARVRSIDPALVLLPEKAASVLDCLSQGGSARDLSSVLEGGTAQSVAPPPCEITTLQQLIADIPIEYGPEKYANETLIKTVATHFTYSDLPAETLNSYAAQLLPKLLTALDNGDPWSWYSFSGITLVVAKAINAIEPRLSPGQKEVITTELGSIMDVNIYQACTFAVESKLKLEEPQLSALLQLTIGSVVSPPFEDRYGMEYQHKLLIKHSDAVATSEQVGELADQLCNYIRAQPGSEVHCEASEYALMLLVKLASADKKNVLRISQAVAITIDHVRRRYDNESNDINTEVATAAILELGHLLPREKREGLLRQIIAPDGPNINYDNKAYRCNILIKIPREFAGNAFPEIVNFFTTDIGIGYAALGLVDNLIKRLAVGEKARIYDGLLNILKNSSDNPCLQVRCLEIFSHNPVLHSLGVGFVKSFLGEAKRLAAEWKSGNEEGAEVELIFFFVKNIIARHVLDADTNKEIRGWLLKSLPDQVEYEVRKEIVEALVLLLPSVSDPFVLAGTGPLVSALKTIQNAFFRCRATLADPPEPGRVSLHSHGVLAAPRALPASSGGSKAVSSPKIF